MRAVLLVAVVLPGCGFAPSQTADDQPIDAPVGDSRHIDGCTSFSQQFDTCSAPQGGDLMLSGSNTFDTNTGTLVTPANTPPAITTLPVTLLTNQVEVDALFVGNFTLAANATLRATGVRPLAIVATGTVTFGTGALLDVSAGGAGALATCNPPTPGADDSNGGAGGGGGGGGAAGAPGGNGDSDNGPSQGGMAGAIAAKPTGVLGGCPGAHGGMGADVGGLAGSGGGAIYIVSAQGITLGDTSGINAGGGGGGAGIRTTGFGDAGGGGGGAGGTIRLEAPHVHSSGILAANGGGGGEGSGNSEAGKNGTAGKLDTTQANGGSGGSSTGADGGKGGALNNPGGGNAASPQAGGGGGGGGAVGYILVVSPDQMLGAKVSPGAS